MTHSLRTRSLVIICRKCCSESPRYHTFRVLQFLIPVAAKFYVFWALLSLFEKPLDMSLICVMGRSGMATALILIGSVLAALDGRGGLIFVLIDGKPTFNRYWMYRHLVLFVNTVE